MARDAILDASALLALLNSEPGADRVSEVIPGALISAVNLAEVVGKLSEAGIPRGAVMEIILSLGLNVVDTTRSQGFTAGFLRPRTRDQGLSLGDRACLALALERGLPTLTADAAWMDAGLDIQVELIR